MSNNELAALIIIDGFGLRDVVSGISVKQTIKPNFDKYWHEYPHASLTACGEAVGLPEGQMGNSEVGHLNIGAGRIVYQSLTRINRAIESGEFRGNETIIQAMKRAKKKNRAVHLLGLLSDGGVHSHMDHLFALLEVAKEQKIEDVFVHIFLDGRDVGPKTAVTYIEQTERTMPAIGGRKVATVSGFDERMICIFT